MKTSSQIGVSAGIPAFVISDYVLSAEVDASVADRIAREVEKFLHLCAKCQTPLAPSVAVDDFWHDFILHTRAYAAFCSKNFGRFIHHNPKRGADAGLRDAYLRTVAAIEREFGSVDETVWPVLKAADCNSDGSDGGGCDGDQAVAKRNVIPGLKAGLADAPVIRASLASPGSVTAPVRVDLADATATRKAPG